MIPSTEQVGWLGKVLGPRGVQLLSRIEVLKSDERCPAYTLSAGSHWPGCVQVIYPGRQSEDPFIFVHEMAHAYHSIHFPHLTELLTDDIGIARAEACALLAEECLASFMSDHPLVEGRIKAWSRAALVSEPIAMAREMARQATLDRIRLDLALHNVFELVLFGIYDHDGEVSTCH